MHASFRRRADLQDSAARHGCAMILASVVLLHGGLPLPARAAVPAWPAAPYRYLVVDQDLRVVLEEFGKNTGIRIALADGVKGRVRGSLPQAPPPEFLDALARSYGLDWYYDGTVLHVSTSAEAETRFLDLHGLPFARLIGGLAQSGLADARYVLRDGPAQGLATVSGPPRYVGLVAQAAAAMVAQKAPAPAAPVVRVFRGSIASR